MADGIHHPHDTLVRTILGRQPSAVAWLRGQIARIDPRLVEQFDWSRLASQSGSFVDADFRTLHSDLVFEVPCKGRPSFIYCVVEHQSRPDPFMAQRLLGYLAAFWKHWREGHPRAKTLPVVIPMVLYTGSQPWTAAPCMHNLLDLPSEFAGSLGPLVPDFRFLLVTLTDEQTAMAGDEIVLRTMLTLMRAVSHGEAEQWLDRHGAWLLEVLQQPDGKGVVDAFLRYLCQAENGPTFSTINEKLLTLKSKSLEIVIMNAAEELMQIGLEKGLEKGLVKGRQEGLVGQIRAYQRVLRQAAAPEEVLGRLSLDELTRLAGDLERQVLALH